MRHSLPLVFLVAVLICSLDLSLSAFADQNSGISPGEIYLAKWKVANPSRNTGVGIVARTRGQPGHSTSSTMFEHVASYSGKSRYIKTGKEFLEFLESETHAQGCIAKINWAGHGWSYRNTAGGPGLPTDFDDNGFYQSSKKGWHARNLGHLSSKVWWNKIKFCSTCLIQIHSCNISIKFSQLLAKTTGCQTVFGTGSVAPIDTSSGSLDYIWTSSQFSGSICKMPDGTACNGEFVRVTPMRLSQAIEKIGHRYISQ